jgi:hypothetical protein
VVDYVLSNSLMELHCTNLIGGRILSIVYRPTGNNQLFDDYPRVPRTQGDRWDKWAEYGGINDWFPGDWPGMVWNNDWSAKVLSKAGNSVSVVFSTKVKNSLLIQKEISLCPESAFASVKYEILNTGDSVQDVFWTGHPDLAPGGQAGPEDQMVVPVKQESSKGEWTSASYSPRNEKTFYVPSENWMLGYDSKSKEYLGQVFDKSLTEKIGAWEGNNFFTMEPTFRKFQLKPGEKKSFAVDYGVGQDELNAAVGKMRSQAR